MTGGKKSKNREEVLILIRLLRWQKIINISLAYSHKYDDMLGAETGVQFTVCVCVGFAS